MMKRTISSLVVLFATVDAQGAQTTRPGSKGDGGESAGHLGGKTKDARRMIAKLLPALTLSFLLQAEISAQGTKWEVRHQLIVGLPWHSENESEADLLAGVKESEATPDNRLVMALNDLAAWYRGQKRYEDAIKTYRRVMELQLRRLGQGGDVAPLPLNDIGVVYTEWGRFAEAEEAFKKSLAGYGTPAPGEVRSDFEAVTLHNYSVLLEKTGRAAEAKETEAKAQAIMAAYRKSLGLEP